MRVLTLWVLRPGRPAPGHVLQAFQEESGTDIYEKSTKFCKRSKNSQKRKRSVAACVVPWAPVPLCPEPSASARVGVVAAAGCQRHTRGAGAAVSSREASTWRSP